MNRGLIAFCVLLSLPGCQAYCGTIAPANDTLYTSTRYVRSIASAPDGTIWVATSGGVLRRSPDGAWTKFTQLDGLPSNEAGRIAVEGDKVSVAFPAADAVFQNGKWTSKPAKHDEEERAPSDPVVFRGKSYRIAEWSLQAREPNGWHSVADIDSISQVFVKDDRLWVATYHSGIRTFDGRSWSVPDLGMPDDAGQMTAMLIVGDAVWIGTRDQGLWQYDGKTWKQHLQPDEPNSNDCVALAMYQGRLYAGTLNGGLAVRSTEGWQGISNSWRLGLLSSNHPKAMLEYDGNLYLLHSSGAVDRFDGSQWNKDVFSSIPRGSNISTLASDGKRLYVGQWGGWSEYDGKAWLSRLRNPSMQGHQVTCVLPDGDTLWVGVQGLGLAEVNQTDGKITWHDERNGLADDWVTCLRKVGDRLYAGTFYHGLAYYENGKWTLPPKLKTQRINDIVPDGKGGVLLAMATGVWRFTGGELTQLFTNPNAPDREANCLCLTDDGLWIGTRTGIYFTKRLPTADATYEL